MGGNWRSGNYGPKEHEARLFLDGELILARSKIEVEYNISPLYAGLLAFTVGCNALRKLSDEECERLKAKYTIPVNAERTTAKAQVLAAQVKAEKSELEPKDRFFKNVVEQWDLHPGLEWQVKMFTLANKYKDKLQSARDILAKDTREPRMEGAI